MMTFANLFRDKTYRWSIIVGFGLLLVSLLANYGANVYAVERASNPVTDIILSNTRVFDLNGLFVYGAFALVGLIAYLALSYPHRLPFIVKSVALFVLIRSVFISLTHLGLYPSHLIVDSNILNKFAKGNDLFFSGHTGLPLLIAFIFWDKVYLRYLFIFLSVLFGIVVLLAHLHYSIDVLAAFFITYSIYRLCELAFPIDLARFKDIKETYVDF